MIDKVFTNHQHLLSDNQPLFASLFLTMNLRQAEHSDSDSAPEDINFKDAKSEALEIFRNNKVLEKEKVKRKRDDIKRKRAKRAEEKELKLKKVKESEAKKLPDHFLAEL